MMYVFAHALDYTNIGNHGYQKIAHISLDILTEDKDDDSDDAFSTDTLTDAVQCTIKPIKISECLQP